MTSRYRYNCSKNIIGPELPENVPRYIPKCCPIPPNRDPRRFEPYCPPVKSLSEPLSHAEYLRMKTANKGSAISSPANLLQTAANTTYGRTVWTATSTPCCDIPIVPAVIPKGSAVCEGLTINSKAAVSGRGSLSRYDSNNRIESITTLRRKGQTIQNTKCTSCSTLSGTEIYSGKCTCLA